MSDEKYSVHEPADSPCPSCQAWGNGCAIHHRCAVDDKRRVALEAVAKAARELEREATEHANATGCPGGLFSALSDVRAALVSLGSDNV